MLEDRERRLSFRLRRRYTVPGEHRLVPGPRTVHALGDLELPGFDGHGAEAAPDAEVGTTLNLYAVSPAGPGEADADAARRIDGLMNRFFLDPLLRGRYPTDVVADLAGVTGFDHVRDGDLAVIATPTTFLAVNYYSRHVVAAPPDGARPDRPGTPSPWPGSEGVRFVGRGLPTTAMGWEIDPAGLTETLLRLHREYPPLPLYVTENGAAFEDVVGPDGAVEDPDRIRFLADHLRAGHEAIAAGVPLRGYFVWSLLDNFEWAHGYRARFGLVRVDYPTQRRIPKASARWYAQVIRDNGLTAGVADEEGGTA